MLRQDVGSLRSRLHTRGRIGIAIGIIMCQRGLDDEHALGVLVRASQKTNRALHLVAEDVISSRLAPLRGAGREARS